MKIFVWLFSGLIYSMLLFSCAKENSGPLYSPQTFSYKVESVTYSGGLAYAVYTDSLKSLDIEFYNNPVYENYLIIRLKDTNYFAPGVYPIGYDTTSHVTLSITHYLDGSHPYAATTGSLTITSFDTVNLMMSGTFQFNAQLYNSVLHITEGEFNNLRYRKQ